MAIKRNFWELFGVDLKANIVVTPAKIEKKPFVIFVKV